MDRDAAIIDELVAVTLKVVASSTEPASVQQSVPAIKAKPNSALKPFTLKRDDMCREHYGYVNRCIRR